MGQAKAEMMRREDLRNVADDVALRAKAIHECERHSGTYLTNSDPDAERLAYAMGTNMVKNGEVDGSREEFMDAIKEAISEAGWECPSCEKDAHD